MLKYLLFLIPFSLLAEDVNATSASLNLTPNQYSFLMGLTGNLVGFTFLLGLILVASRK
ncbi:MULTISPECIES: hypothetical protein [unclassified Sulfurospirillum]|uniref:hypothetical protein n=1 Tax=unclassified Sulfurospirillum TaxID=2618290 RepID=UPI000AD536B6|nr:MULTISPECIES: hypothetical protein [unclassified Sulfurospirillum]